MISVGGYRNFTFIGKCQRAWTERTIDGATVPVGFGRFTPSVGHAKPPGPTKNARYIRDRIGLVGKRVKPILQIIQAEPAINGLRVSNNMQVAIGESELVSVCRGVFFREAEIIVPSWY